MEQAPFPESRQEDVERRFKVEVRVKRCEQDFGLGPAVLARFYVDVKAPASLPSNDPELMMAVRSVSMPEVWDVIALMACEIEEEDGS